MSATSALRGPDRRKAEFRQRIIDAALKLFQQQGVAATRVADIIREADIAHKTFFNHFPTKDHLLQHIALAYSDYAYAFFHEALARFDSPQKRLSFCLLSIARPLQGLHPNYRELINHYLISGVGAPDLRNAQKDGFIALVQEILVDARKQRLLRRDMALPVLAEMITSLCMASLLNWSLEPGYPLEKKMREVVRFINSSVFVDETAS